MFTWHATVFRELGEAMICLLVYISYRKWDGVYPPPKLVCLPISNPTLEDVEDISITFLFTDLIFLVCVYNWIFKLAAHPEQVDPPPPLPRYNVQNVVAGEGLYSKIYANQKHTALVLHLLRRFAVHFLFLLSLRSREME